MPRVGKIELKELQHRMRTNSHARFTRHTKKAVGRVSTRKAGGDSLFPCNALSRRIFASPHGSAFVVTRRSRLLSSDNSPEVHYASCMHRGDPRALREPLLAADEGLEMEVAPAMDASVKVDDLENATIEEIEAQKAKLVESGRERSLAQRL